jgi:hypothetical protein
MDRHNAMATTALVLCLGAAGLWAAPFEKQFRITEVSGSCTVQLPGQPATPAVKGLSCPYGTRITTERRATAVLELSNGNRVRVLAATTMAVTEDAQDPSAKIVRLAEGRIRVQLEPNSHKNNRFTVETPVAICGIVGCDMEFAVESGGSLSVNVVEGLVNLSGRTQTGTWNTQLDPGDRAVITGGGQQAVTLQAVNGQIEVQYTNSQGQPQTVVVPQGAGIQIAATTVTLPNGTTALSVTVTIRQAGSAAQTIVVPPIPQRYPGQ